MILSLANAATVPDSSSATPSTPSFTFTILALMSRSFSIASTRFSVVVPVVTAIDLPARSPKPLTVESARTRKPPPSTNMRLLKSTSFIRDCDCVVFAHSRSALPLATIAMRLGTVSTTQLMASAGTPMARPMPVIARLHRSIE